MDTIRLLIGFCTSARYSFDEVARHDIPVMIDTILAKSNSTQLDYIGHSLGNSHILASLSYHPEYNAKIRKYVALAPAAHIGNMTSIIKAISAVPPCVMVVSLHYETR